MKPLTRKQSQAIIAMADCDMRPSKAAAILGLHKNTIEYHATNIRSTTGLDPKCFYDLCKLVKMVNGIEPVDIVRCKNCRWNSKRHKVCTNPKVAKSFYGCPVPDMHFCSYGERRKDRGK